MQALQKKLLVVTFPASETHAQILMFFTAKVTAASKNFIIVLREFIHQIVRISDARKQ